MSNTHSQPDLLKEIQALAGDLLPACLLTSSGLTPPGSGLTLSAASVQAYARSATDLVYIDQPAISVTVPNVAGNHWLIVHRDSHSTVAGWTRRAGSHFLTQQAATQPTTPDACVLCAQITVTAGNITAVDTAPALTPPLSRQTADAVAITGGSLILASAPIAPIQITNGPTNTLALHLLNTAGTGKYNCYASGSAPNYFAGNVGIGGLASNAFDVFGAATITQRLMINDTMQTDRRLSIRYTRATEHGLILKPDADSGNYAILFMNAAASFVGGISTSSTTTTYNTGSDRRLKRNITPLEGALATLRQLRPVSYFWQVNDEYGEGFLGDELQRAIPYAVTGEPDAVDAQGNVLPQGVDMGKIVPALTAALKELLAQVEALTARVQSLEEQLGI